MVYIYKGDDKLQFIQVLRPLPHPLSQYGEDCGDLGCAFAPAECWQLGAWRYAEIQEYTGVWGLRALGLGFRLLGFSGLRFGIYSLGCRGYTFKSVSGSLVSTDPFKGL